MNSTILFSLSSPLTTVSKNQQLLKISHFSDLSRKANNGIKSINSTSVSDAVALDFLMTQDVLKIHNFTLGHQCPNPQRLITDKEVLYLLECLFQVINKENLGGATTRSMITMYTLSCAQILTRSSQ